MKKVHKIGIVLLTILLGMFLMTSVNAKEPTRPEIKKIDDPKKVVKINEVKSLPIDEAFNRLKGNDFFLDNDLLDNAVFESFKDRKEDALAYSIENLKKPRIELMGGEIADRTLDLFVAKKILQMFPDESLYSLLDMYEHAEAATKVNIIFALGNMEGDPAIRNLLLTALDDKTVWQEENPEMIGEPLRICDEAYNQLVLRYEIENVLRTIGNGHAIEDRDYQIEMLKNML
jgi:hypothetical protein